MAEARAAGAPIAVPAPSTVLELLKPVTWFAPMWAFGCGVVSSGASFSAHPGRALLGVLLAGPLVCGTSQAVNDWFDRHVDAINEPGRPIPSGRIPGRWGLAIALAWTGASVLVAALLGPVCLAAALVGLALAWAYSAPPLRLKRNGWWGNAACGACYEGLPWITGAAVASGGVPSGRILAAAALYSIGAHGIMTLNDFKSVAGDTATGIRSLPVQLGVTAASRMACTTMALPQVAVITLLLRWDRPLAAGAVALALLGQGVLMRRFLAEPAGRAAWYNATGTLLYVLGMLACAFGIAAA